MLTFTKNSYTPLQQKDFKQVVVYRVENTQKEYARYIRDYDYKCFLLELLEIKLNKDGSIPKNLNRSIYIKGGKLDENHLKTYGYNSFLLKTKQGYFRIYTRELTKSYGKNYIHACLMPCDKQGWTHEASYEVDIVRDFNNVKEFNELVNKEIEVRRNHQKEYINKLRAIPKVAKQIEKLNLYGLYAATVQGWF